MSRGGSTARSATSIDEFAIVIPARDEQLLIGACLRAINIAIARTHRALWWRTPTISVTVVADGCTDGTADVVRTFPAVTLVERAAAGVGAARRTGAAVALSQSCCAPGSFWLANTDADSRVPPGWILEQLAAASAGSDALIGTVRPVFNDLSPEQVRAWEALHRGERANGHVHGANLGVRASAYLAAGGFDPVQEHEDVDLVARIRAGGFTATASSAAEVLTSGRQSGRAPGGYAGYLRTLATASIVPDPV
ncbi:MAG: glycosyl transferase [Glaciihabitans sp.]|nr:glycosyl transferase [Glaciihabitans sp.]